jgi:hypothetical protein
MGWKGSESGRRWIIYMLTLFAFIVGSGKMGTI